MATKTSRSLRQKYGTRTQRIERSAVKDALNAPTRHRYLWAGYKKRQTKKPGANLKRGQGLVKQALSKHSATRVKPSTMMNTGVGNPNRMMKMPPSMSQAGRIANIGTIGGYGIMAAQTAIEGLKYYRKRQTAKGMAATQRKAWAKKNVRSSSVKSNRLKKSLEKPFTVKSKDQGTYKVTVKR